jgi:hypothetical protein
LGRSRAEEKMERSKSSVSGNLSEAGSSAGGSLRAVGNCSGQLRGSGGPSEPSLAQRKDCASD